MPVLGVFGQGSSAKLYLPVRVVEVSSITTGFLATLANTSLSFDGNQALMPASGTAGSLPGWLGVAAADIATVAYGLIQCYGLNSSIHVSQQATSITINVGDACIPGAEKGGCISVVPTYLNAGFKFILASGTPNTTSLAISANYMAGFIRCL